MLDVWLAMGMLLTCGRRTLRTQHGVQGLSEPHVAADLHAPLQGPGEEVPLAPRGADEIILGDRDGAVGRFPALGHGHTPVIDGDVPVAGPLDLESVRAVDAAELRLKSAPGKRREESSCTVRHGGPSCRAIRVPGAAAVEWALKVVPGVL